MGMPSALRDVYLRWLQKRNPRSVSVTLNQRRIFIMPGRAGLLYGMTCLALFISAINYENNLLFALCFLMVSLFLTGILHTYKNFSGLSLTAGQGLPVFAGEPIMLPMTIGAGPYARYQLRMGFVGEIWQLQAQVDNSSRVVLPLSTTHRGPLQSGRLGIESVYPLGLLRTWSWLYLDFQGLVYPAPIFGPFRYVATDGEGQQGGAEIADPSGQDDFRGLRTYQPGDNLRHIAWKQVARGRPLMTKEFEEVHAGRHWLSWYALPPADVEEKLSRLCGWVLRSHEENLEYGLILPDQRIAVGRGDQQRDLCLRALALYGGGQHG
ncbi:MAG: DUF58 domain-containing protein [Oceanospirillaceae bacterium]|nr:DUF58 domain-containing protein [Oceanospirillaceae bacterium]